MSTKTLRKRIALATVAALGAGILSATVANAANTWTAAIGNVNVAPSVGATNPAATAHSLNIASSLTTDGTTGASLTTRTSLRSVGLLAVGDLAGTYVSGTTQTATLLSSGKIVVYTSNASNTADMISVTGGTITANGSAAAYKSDGTAIAVSNTSSLLSAVVSPNAGATSVKINLYSTNDNTVAAADLISGAASGTLTGVVNVTVTSTNVAGALSAAKSGIYYADSTTNVGGRTSDSVTTGVGTAEWATQQFSNIRTRDAYGVSVGSGGLLQVSATNGALVKIVANAGSASPTNTSDYYTSASDPDNTDVVIAAPDASILVTSVATPEPALVTRNEIESVVEESSITSTLIDDA